MCALANTHIAAQNLSTANQVIGTRQGSYTIKYDEKTKILSVDSIDTRRIGNSTDLGLGNKYFNYQITDGNKKIRGTDATTACLTIGDSMRSLNKTLPNTLTDMSLSSDINWLFEQINTACNAVFKASGGPGLLRFNPGK